MPSRKKFWSRSAIHLAYWQPQWHLHHLQKPVHEVIPLNVWTDGNLTEPDLANKVDARGVRSHSQVQWPWQHERREPMIRVGHGSLFCDPIGPDPRFSWPDPSRSMSVDLWPDPVRRDRLMKNIINLFCVQRIICRPIAYNILQSNCKLTAMSAIQLLLKYSWWFYNVCGWIILVYQNGIKRLSFSAGCLVHYHGCK